MVRVGVCGITGSQGGAVSKILLENNCEVVGLTRNLDTDTSQDLINSGVNLKKADFDDTETLNGVLTVVMQSLLLQIFGNIWILKENIHRLKILWIV